MELFVNSWILSLSLRVPGSLPIHLLLVDHRSLWLGQLIVRKIAHLVLLIKIVNLSIAIKILDIFLLRLLIPNVSIFSVLDIASWLRLLDFLVRVPLVLIHIISYRFKVTFSVILVLKLRLSIITIVLVSMLLILIFDILVKILCEVVLTALAALIFDLVIQHVILKLIEKLANVRILRHDSFKGQKVDSFFLGNFQHFLDRRVQKRIILMFELQLLDKSVKLIGIDPGRSINFLNRFLKRSLKNNKAQRKGITFDLIVNIAIQFVFSQIFVTNWRYIKWLSFSQLFIIDSLDRDISLLESKQFELRIGIDKNGLGIDISMRSPLFL